MQERTQAFLGAQELEEAPFMGDASAFLRLANVASAPNPALDCDGMNFRITELGLRVLAGAEDWVLAQSPGSLPRKWIGGVALFEGAPEWRWNGVRETVELRRTSIP